MRQRVYTNKTKLCSILYIIHIKLFTYKIRLKKNIYNYFVQGLIKLSGRTWLIHKPIFLVSDLLSKKKVLNLIVIYCSQKCISLANTERGPVSRIHCKTISLNEISETFFNFFEYMNARKSNYKFILMYSKL